MTRIGRAIEVGNRVADGIEDGFWRVSSALTMLAGVALAISGINDFIHYGDSVGGFGVHSLHELFQKPVDLLINPKFDALTDGPGKIAAAGATLAVAKYLMPKREYNFHVSISRKTPDVE